MWYVWWSTSPCKLLELKASSSKHVLNAQVAIRSPCCASPTSAQAFLPDMLPTQAANGSIAPNATLKLKITLCSNAAI